MSYGGVHASKSGDMSVAVGGIRKADTVTAATVVDNDVNHGSIIRTQVREQTELTSSMAWVKFIVCLFTTKLYEYP